MAPGFLVSETDALSGNNPPLSLVGAIFGDLYLYKLNESGRPWVTNPMVFPHSDELINSRLDN